MVSPSDNEEEDDLVAKVLSGMTSAKEVQDMLLHTDPTGAAGEHENQAGIMPGSQGEMETEVQDEATTWGAELLLTDARVRDVYYSMSQLSPAFNTTVPVRPHARDTPRAESDLLKPPPVSRERECCLLVLNLVSSTLTKVPSGIDNQQCAIQMGQMLVQTELAMSVLLMIRYTHMSPVTALCM